MSHVYIAVAGNIGVGKTSLVERMCRHFAWQPIYEAVAHHPYLEDYYRDMPRWGFHSQIYFLTMKLRQQQAIAASAQSCCQDRSIYEDAEIFARSLADQDILSARDFETYTLLYESIVGTVPRPNLLIYLRASVPTLAERIVSRGRTSEKGISLAYLERLNVRYEQWIAGFGHCPVLVLPADQLDFVHNVADLTQVFDQVTRALAPRLDLPPMA
ncbi:MAG: deoxynucleoside kinase [Chloroflexi bacterium]|nr:deoxynucleoside kinase [Chloroflexota bacterium]MBU1751117.1 deoxynucleoside kinase [Chloroflexota bacterium]